MAPSHNAFWSIAVTLALFATLPMVVAHGGGGSVADEHGTDTHAHASHENVVEQMNESEYPPTYFSHPEYAGLIYAHIVLMSLAWIIILPLVVMLSLVSSRYTLGLQLAFLTTNGAGITFGTMYNAKTPDLYPGNAHHSFGWIITCIISAQVMIRLATILIRRGRTQLHGSSEERPLFMRGLFKPREDFQQLHEQEYRLSQDSGQGSESRAESLRSSSASTVYDEQGPGMSSPYKELDDNVGNIGDLEDLGNLEAMPVASSQPSRVAAWFHRIASVGPSRWYKYVDQGLSVVDRVILPLGFAALATGVATYARFFEGHGIYGGLAHWIKGGVFFWLGLFNLGRWSGSFAELGWAWNARPRRARDPWRPSAEFVESALIFFYGSTNVFLEHLGGWGQAWSAQDLEHISITILFIGGGLCGMLVESSQVRKFLNTNVELLRPEDIQQVDEEERSGLERLEYPEAYDFSVNPIPALIILLLGIMMSSHHQTTMISTMIHKQWGNLLTGASAARGLTYVIVYLRPPKSVFPSRPPTELLASFGLIAGGIIFMASSGDTVDGMIHYDLDAMFMYTVTMGLVGLLMAWEIFVLAVKGWASRKERQP